MRERFHNISLKDLEIVRRILRGSNEPLATDSTQSDFSGYSIDDTIDSFRIARHKYNADDSISQQAINDLEQRENELQRKEKKLKKEQEDFKAEQEKMEAERKKIEGEKAVIEKERADLDERRNKIEDAEFKKSKLGELIT